MSSVASGLKNVIKLLWQFYISGCPVLVKHTEVFELKFCSPFYLAWDLWQNHTKIKLLLLLSSSSSSPSSLLLFITQHLQWKFFTPLYCFGSGMFSDIEDNQLDELVQTASSQHPGMGIRMLKGYLQSKGFRIQRERIRLSLLRTDPIGIMERWRSTTRRRHYNVRYPLSLWHIDGNHKLIRYW